MDDLSEYYSEVVELLPPNNQAERRQQLVDSCSGTDPPPASKENAVQTNCRCDAFTQTATLSCSVKLSAAEERKLGKWLLAICPVVELELEHPTPSLDSDDPLLDLSEQLRIETYQKIEFGSAGEHTQGMAIWLSLHTNDAPLLLLTATPTGSEDWCEAGLQQCLKLYQPTRLESGNYVAYTEVDSVPVKLVKALCTNAYNKTVFAGSTLDGDIYVWQYIAGRSPSASTTRIDGSASIKEVHSSNCSHGWALAIDWASEQRLVTAHAGGWIVQWALEPHQSQLRQQWAYQIRPGGLTIASNEISALVCVSASEFVVGTKDGGIYQCWHASLAGLSLAGGKPQFELVPLRKHHFMVSTLLRAQLDDLVVVISCDLSGELFFHDMRHSDEEYNSHTANLIAHIPLPFKNAVACSNDGRVIYAPGVDGSLDCYRVQDGQYTSIKGALRGKGSFIKCSDNGRWLVTGLYENEFQLFYAETES